MKIAVAMSGGIDSSVCVFLLKQKGYDVFGITLILTDDYLLDKDRGAIFKSRLLCEKLGIKHETLDLRNEFNDFVVKDFNFKISKGITPVPCSVCNSFIKFGKLFNFCLSKDAKLATGHYAKICENNDEFNITRAKDLLKDQTHFLYNINKEILPKLIFPLGDLLKSEVFRLAQQQNIIDVSSYKESQDVCFFNNLSFKEYVENLKIKEKQGDIIHIKTGLKLGVHNGLLKYTIGQRQGLGVAWSEPLYVVKKDINNNILYIGEENCLYCKDLIIKNINILSNSVLTNIIKNRFLHCQVCLRDKTPLIDAKILFNDDKLLKLEDILISAKVELTQPARAITSGQVCVFYYNNTLLGGGEIV